MIRFKKFFAKTNYKQLIGLGLVFLGVIFFFFSVNAMKKIAKAQSLSDSVSNFFEHNTTWNPIIKFFGGEAQEEMNYYSTQVLIIQIASVAVTAVGSAMLVLYRKRRPSNKEKKRD